MLYYPFRILCLFLLTTSAMAAQFTTPDCIKANFKADITHEGEFWGLLKSHLNIDKKECVINITFKKIFETQWKVDVCREPIHLKQKDKTTLSVFKRESMCSGRDTDYCDSYEDLMERVRDFGLIFAEGERESLKSKHGQVYCSFLLLRSYLEKGNVLSKYSMEQNIFPEEKSSAKDIEFNPEIIESNPSLKLKDDTDERSF